MKHQRAITENQVSVLLEQYQIKLHSVGEVLKDDHVSLCIALDADIGKLVLKVYRKFSQSTVAGLEIVKELDLEGFPTNNLICNLAGDAYTNYDNFIVSLHGFITYPPREYLNSGQVGELGKYLGRLHSKTTKRVLTGGEWSWSNFNELLTTQYNDRGLASSSIKNVIEYMYSSMGDTKCQSGQPKSANHVEFTAEHTRFDENGSLRNVLDWDLINRDYCIYDIGTSLTSCFDKHTLDFNKIRHFVKNYDKERKLTEWEKDHLYEALLYGSFKFCIWSLSDPHDNSLNLTVNCRKDIERVEILMSINKQYFQSKL